MLSLPSKPWKKVRIDELGNDQLRVVFVSDLESEAQFDEVIAEDIVASLGEHDDIISRDWPSRSMVVRTASPVIFRRNLVFASIMIELP